MRRPIISLTVMLFVLVATHCLAREVVYYIHNDHLGTPQIMTDQAGRVVWKAEYEPFGKAIVDEDPDGDGMPVENNLRFPGQYYDAETGLHYNYHRDYDPGTGRYLEADLIGIIQGKNHLYVYVSGDPLNKVDPHALWGANIHSGIGSYLDGTYPWALDAGFSSEDAAIIALADNAVDAYSNYAVVVGVPGRHFDTAMGARDSRTLFADTELALAVSLYRKCDKTEALRTLGRGLHSVQDRYAHANAPFLIIHPSWYDDPVANYSALCETRGATAEYLRRFISLIKYSQ